MSPNGALYINHIITKAIIVIIRIIILYNKYPYTDTVCYRQEGAILHLMRSNFFSAKFDYQDPINTDSCLKDEEKIVRYSKSICLI